MPWKLLTALLLTLTASLAWGKPVGYLLPTPGVV